MQYCPKCKINIRGHKTCCPLCQGQLQGEPEKNPFPVLAKPKVSNLTFFRICTFILILLELSLLLVRYFAGPQAWSTLLGLSAVIAWADLWIASYFRNNIMKMIVVQLYLLMLITLFFDWNTGMHGWSVAWVIPSLFLSIAIATVIIGKNRRLPLETYVMYLFWNVVLSFLQLIAVHLDRNPFPAPAVVSTFLLLVLGAAVVVFRFRALKNAAGKWFSL